MPDTSRTSPGARATSRTRPGWPARRAWAGPGFVRATGADPDAAGSDPDPDLDHEGPLSRDPTTGEAPGGRRDQAVLGGHRHHRGLLTGDARGDDRRPARPGHPRQPGQTADAVQDPGPDRGANRQVQRTPPPPDPPAPGPDRPTQRGHRRADRPDRGGDRTLSSRPGPADHHPRDQRGRRGCRHRRDRRRHDPLLSRRAPGLLGRDQPGQQRVRRPGQIDPHQTRRPLPQGHTGRRGH